MEKNLPAKVEKITPVPANKSTDSDSEDERSGVNVPHLARRTEGSDTEFDEHQQEYIEDEMIVPGWFGICFAIFSSDGQKERNFFWYKVLYI